MRQNHSSIVKMNPTTRKFKHHENNPLPAEIILIDECSMIDVFWQDIFAAMSHHSNVILVGDTDRLPSVGPGAFYQDIIKHFSDHAMSNTDLSTSAGLSDH